MEQPVRARSGCAGRAAELRIVSVQPDLEHAVIEVVGAFDDDGVHDLRRRLDALLVAGARFVLVDLSRVSVIVPPLAAVLATAARELEPGRGWLRVIGDGRWSSKAAHEAALPELFAMYRAVSGPIAVRPHHVG
jgi:hypothetical protein